MICLVACDQDAINVDTLQAYHVIPLPSLSNTRIACLSTFSLRTDSPFAFESIAKNLPLRLVVVVAWYHNTIPLG